MLDSERDRIFGDWLAAHKGTLFKVVRAYAFEHADRQDLFQEVAIQVWRSVDAYRGDSSVKTWIYATTGYSLVGITPLGLPGWPPHSAWRGRCLRSSGAGRRASRALATRFGITCGVVSRNSTPRWQVSGA